MPRKVARKQPVIKVVDLNNKSRKGKYVYVRKPKGRAAYYKYKEGVSINNYLLAYEGKVKIKKTGVIEYTKEKPAEKYLKKIKKAPTIESYIPKGIGTAYIDNFRLSGRKGIHSAYKEMLKGVQDNELLNVLALEENIAKLKHRIQTVVTIHSKDGSIEIPLKVFNKTLGEIENDFQKILRTNEVMQGDVNGLLKKEYKFDGIPKGVDVTDYDRMLVKSLGKITVKLRFVKGR